MSFDGRFKETGSDSSQPEPILVARDVIKTFNLGGSIVRAVDGVTLDVHSGDTLTIVGPSGSGKSTFLRCLNGLESIDSGDVLFDGRSLTNDRRVHELRAEIGMVFQNFNLFPHLSVLNNVMLAQRLVRGRSANEADAKATALLESVGLADKRGAYPGQLSGGQQQRVAIARALALDPAVMLFDEPTSSLDPEMVGEVILAMKNLAASGMTMVVVTHEMGFARESASRIVMMDQGAFVEVSDDPAAFFQSPTHSRTRSFLERVR